MLRGPARSIDKNNSCHNLVYCLCNSHTCSCHNHNQQHCLFHTRRFYFYHTRRYSLCHNQKHCPCHSQVLYHNHWQFPCQGHSYYHNICVTTTVTHHSRHSHCSYGLKLCLRLTFLFIVQSAGEAVRRWVFTLLSAVMLSMPTSSSSR